MSKIPSLCAPEVSPWNSDVNERKALHRLNRRTTFAGIARRSEKREPWRLPGDSLIGIFSGESMTLPKPPKDYYRLAEVAAEWGWTVEDILDYAEQGKILLCVNLRIPVTVSSLNALAPDREEQNISGVHFLTSDSIRFLQNPGKLTLLSFNLYSEKEGKWRTMLGNVEAYNRKTISDALVIIKNEKICCEQDILLLEGGVQENPQQEVLTIPPETKYPTGGAPEATITRAVRLAYSKLESSGNTELIKPGKIKGFIKYLKECITEGNPNYSDDVAECIKEVKNVDGDCKIIINPLTPKEKRQHSTTGRNIIIKKNRISSILSELRNTK